MRDDVDVNEWPTKQEAAVQLEVSETSIERLLKQRRLKKRTRRGNGPAVVVIDPKSIADCRQCPGDLAEEEITNPRASVALARIVEHSILEHSLAPVRPGGSLSGLEAAFLAFLQSKTAGSPVPVERRIFLTLAESAELSGLPAVFLRRLIATGKLKALKTGAGWRVPRVELENLSGALTITPENLGEAELRDMELNRLRRQGFAPKSDDLPIV
jgi:excisionase family DNA binding protein